MKGQGTIFKRGSIWHVCYASKGRTIRESARTTKKVEAEQYLLRRMTESRYGKYLENGPTIAVHPEEINEQILEEAKRLTREMGSNEYVGGVYFIKPDGFSFLKIGYSAQEADQRRSALQCAWPVTLVTVLMVPGPRGLELSLQKCFRPFRARNEWFHCGFTLAAFIEWAEVFVKDYFTVSHGQALTDGTSQTLHK